MNNAPSFVFWGGEPLGVPALNALKKAGLIPRLIVCNPDRPSGRGQQLTIPKVKAWALENDIPIFQPDSLKNKEELISLTSHTDDLFVVVAYNKILPEWIINLPSHGTLNLHPSLLPKLRGASPIRSAIVRNEKSSVGVTVMKMAIAMDSGDIIAQRATDIADDEWPCDGLVLDDILADEGSNLLARTIPKWLDGTLEATPQNHAEATYCGRIEKKDGELTLDPDSMPQGNAALEMLCKIRGYAGFPGTYFFHDGIRIKITSASLSQSGTLVIHSITPEGKKPTDWKNYFKK